MIAHPWGRRGGTVLDESALATLKDLGLAGIEVDHQDHGPGPARAAARASPPTSTSSSPAAATTTASARSTTTSGVNTTDPEQYERLLSLAGNPLGG